MASTSPRPADPGAPRWVMNPYRIAELLLDKPLGAGGNAREFLVEAFQTKVERLFDPRQDAPTLLDDLRNEQQAGRAYGTLAEAIDSLRRSTGARSAGFADEQLARVLPWLLDVKELPPPPGAGSGPEPVSQKVHGDVLFDRLSYLDPRQGAVADCFLIAAMIAIAWTLPVQWKKRVTGARPTATEPGFHCWRLGTPEGEAAVQVDADVWVDANGVPVFATSVDADEQWPGIVEKAFVMLLNGAAPRADPKPKAYQAVGGNLAEWPHQAAARLLGLPPARTRFIATSQPGARPLSSHIDDRLKSDSAAVPVMASTWPKETLAERSKDPDSKVRANAKTAIDVFNSTLTALPMNHAFAVLGMLNDGGKQFVVLRDPHSADHPRREHCAEGVWRPRSERHGVSEVKLHQRGVFALERDTFDQLFFAVSWIEPSPAQG